MNKFDKGISTSVGILIILVVAIVAFGGVFAYEYFAIKTPLVIQPQKNIQTQNVSTATTTQIIYYIPSVQTQNIPVESGSCWENSIAADRADAWRCMVGNEISDPCFQIPQSSELLCGNFQGLSNNTNHVFLLSLTQPLPTPENIPANLPINSGWRIELSNGVICTPFTGTVPIALDGESAPYGCDGGLLIFGTLDNSKPLWTAKVGTLSDVEPSNIIGEKIISVAKVWQ